MNATSSSSDFEKKKDFESWTKGVIESIYEEIKRKRSEISTSTRTGEVDTEDEGIERRHNGISTSTVVGEVDIKSEEIKALEKAIRNPDEGLRKTITNWRDIPRLFHEFITSVIQNKKYEDKDPLFSFGLIYERFNAELENLKSQTPKSSSSDYVSIQTSFPVLPQTFDFVSDALDTGKVTVKWVETSYWRNYYDTIRSATNEDRLRYSVRFLILLASKLEKKAKVM